jgi:hypothetical protein
MGALTMSTAKKYTVQEILSQLDDCAKECEFLVLDNGYVYPIGSRLNAYRDDQRWAIVIEHLGFNYQGGGHDGIYICLYCYGNCLKREPGTAEEDFLCITSDGLEGPTFDEEYEMYVNSNARSIKVRDSVIPLEFTQTSLEAIGVNLVEPPKITVPDLLRGLIVNHRELLLASEEELRERVPQDLPLFFRLDDWYHPDIADEILPSAVDTFRMIAEALVEGDSTLYAPTQAPNTHWSNWPEGGTL